MKSINQYITEFININNVKIYKYHPKTKEELIKNIQTELNNDNTDLNCIDVSNISDFSELFSQVGSFSIKLDSEQQKTLDVSGWNVHNADNMFMMFYGCDDFDGEKNCNNWKLKKDSERLYMFGGCEKTPKWYKKL